MGIISEIVDFVSRYSFYDIIYEYQQGLLYRNGVVQEHIVKRNKKELEEIVAEEAQIYEQMLDRFNPAGYLYFLTPFTRPELPEGITRNRIHGLPDSEEVIKEAANTGILKYLNRALNRIAMLFSKPPEGWIKGYTGVPLHPKRYERSKLLRPGLYFFIPILEVMVKDFKREKVLNLENITVPTVDAEGQAIIISCNIRYELMDFYKAYNAVHDYEDSLKDHTLSILAAHSRGRTFAQWSNPDTIKELEQAVLEDVQSLVTEKWGLLVHKIYITDNVKCSIQRVMYDGKPLPYIK